MMRSSAKSESSCEEQSIAPTAVSGEKVILMQQLLTTQNQQHHG